VCRAVELQVGRRLTAVHLAQMAFVLPTTIHLELGRTARAPRTVRLTLAPQQEVSVSEGQPAAGGAAAARTAFAVALRTLLAAGEDMEAALEAVQVAKKAAKEAPAEATESVAPEEGAEHAAR
jgi:hypothetical protein